MYCVRVNIGGSFLFSSELLIWGIIIGEGIRVMSNIKSVCYM